MIKYCIILLFLFQISLAVETFLLVRVTDLDQYERAELSGFGMLDYNTSKSENELYLYVSKTNYDSKIKSFYNNEIIISDLSKYYSDRLSEHKSTNNFKSGEYFRTGSLGGYFRLDEIYYEFDRMMAKYPELISKEIIGFSLKNNPVYSYFIGQQSKNPNDDFPAVLITAHHHGNEPGSAFALLYYMWDLFENYDNNVETANYIFNNRQIYVIPAINPDGVIYNDTTFPNGGGMWRKNRRINTDSSIGVDLNRNYGPDYAWDAPNNGSSSRGHLETFRGTSAFSEPETRNVRDFMKGKKIKIAVNVHTYGNAVFYPYSYQTAENPDSLWYRAFLSQNYRNNGYLFGLDVDVIRFPYRGTSDDFMYLGSDDFSGVLPMTLEIGRPVNGFWAPLDTMLKDAEKNLTFFENTILSAGQNIAISDKDVLKIDDRYFIKIVLQNIGYETINNFSFKPKSLNQGIFIENSEIIGNSILRGDTASYLIEYFPVDIDNGEIVEIELEINIGYKKILKFSIPVYEYFEYSLFDSEFMENWNLEGGWNINDSETSGKYLSSNEGEYYSAKINSYSTFSIPETKDSMARYLLRFDHRIEIETNFDFGLIWTMDKNNVWKNINYGEYMVGGSNREGGIQDDTLSGFHGMFRYWMPQNLYLTKPGDSISKFAFNLRTDNGLNKRGWNIRDLKLRAYPFKRTPETSVKDKHQNSIVYPNPASDFITITISNKGLQPFATTDKVQIFDVLGIEIMSESIHQRTGSHRMNIEKLPVGVYFIRIGNKVEKFVKN